MTTIEKAIASKWSKKVNNRIEALWYDGEKHEDTIIIDKQRRDGVYNKVKGECLAAISLAPIANREFLFILMEKFLADVFTVDSYFLSMAYGQMDPRTVAKTFAKYI